MVKNLEHISGSYLIFRLMLIFVLLNPLSGQDTTLTFVKKDTTFYPGKPLLMSLIIPGLGQVYNKEPIWKPSLFFGTEILTLASVFYANKRADEIRINYQDFADENWSIQNWWNFTQSGPTVIENNGIYFTDNKLNTSFSFRFFTFPS